MIGHYIFNENVYLKNINQYRPVAQIPQCTSPMSHNATFCNRNVHICAHFCYKMMHCVMRCGICEMVLFSEHRMISLWQPLVPPVTKKVGIMTTHRVQWFVYLCGCDLQNTHTAFAWWLNQSMVSQSICQSSVSELIIQSITINHTVIQSHIDCVSAWLKNKHCRSPSFCIDPRDKIRPHFFYSW